jgi:ssDNA-binding Zn-finger/Zn-ribbon topoisomerase 1
MSFMAEVAKSVQHLGVKTCPVCGSEEGLSIGRRPVLIVDGEFPSSVGGTPLEADRDRLVTYAVQIECTTCGYLMHFNSERYRRGDEQTLVLGEVEGE